MKIIINRAKLLFALTLVIGSLAMYTLPTFAASEPTFGAGDDYSTSSIVNIWCVKDPGAGKIKCY
ncbi:MAG: hypothetical protein AAF702_09255 [Chloroflexota bacterium]